MELQLIWICFWEHQNDPLGKTVSPLFWRASFCVRCRWDCVLLQGFLGISRVQFDKYPYEREFYDFDVTVEVFLVFALIGAGVLLVQSVSARSNPVELHLRHRNCP